MPMLSKLAQACLRTIEAAEKDLGQMLAGNSPLDLVADKYYHISLDELKSALAELGYELYEKDRR